MCAIKLDPLISISASSNAHQLLLLHLSHIKHMGDSLHGLFTKPLNNIQSHGKHGYGYRYGYGYGSDTRKHGCGDTPKSKQLGCRYISDMSLIKYIYKKYDFELYFKNWTININIRARLISMNYVYEYGTYMIN